MAWYGDWRPYVPVAKRRAKAAAYAARLAKKEKRALLPVKIAGRKIATSFWGQAWCDNLERYSDFANRLPRGRTYARNGSVIDLLISRGKIKSIVSGSEIYRVEVEIAVLKQALWKQLKRHCSSTIDSLLDLLQGRFDQGVMQRLTQRDEGLFPKPKEIKMRCSCPDWAGLCKHVAATLYCVGARLDAAPELLFTLRGVDQMELVSEAIGKANLDRALSGTASAALVDAELSEVFGIEIELETNGDSAADGAHEVGKRKGAVSKSLSRQTKAGSKSVRKKNKSAKEQNVAIQHARPEKRSEEKPARTSGSVEKARAGAKPATSARRQTAAGPAPTSTAKRSRASTSARKRPKAS